MTDADDAGLVGAFHSQMRRGSYTTAVETFTEIMKEVLENADAQRREIEELRRERDIANEAWKGTRCAELREQVRAEKAEAALAEATKLLKYASSHANYIGSGRYEVRFTDVWHSAASAFASKHGGRDG